MREKTLSVNRADLFDGEYLNLIAQDIAESIRLTNKVIGNSDVKAHILNGLEYGKDSVRWVDGRRYDIKLKIEN